MGMILRIERISTRKKDVEGLSCGFGKLTFLSQNDYFFEQNSFLQSTFSRLLR